MIVGALTLMIAVGAVIVAVPVATLLLETIGSIALPRRNYASSTTEPNRACVGVLVPAHNEEQMLSGTIPAILSQLRGADRLLVVADNCSDSTAAVAKSLGAEVIVRVDLAKRGKGFALDYGVRHFAKDPPDIVVIVDADCKLGDFAMDQLASLCSAINQPVQALYKMVAPADSSSSVRFREFAWRVKNWIRPLGLSSVGLPCQLMGTGMAFPWEIIVRANLATGALVEDLKLGLELADDGHPAQFCPTAVVLSEFPISGEGTRSQQLRWEQGHLGVIATEVPRFFWNAVRRGNINLFVLALDAAVPPLSLLGMLVVVSFAVSLGAWWLGLNSTPVLISLCNLVGFASAVICCWLKAGRDLLPLSSAVSISREVLRKIPLYYRIMLRKTESIWVRTDRRRM